MSKNSSHPDFLKPNKFQPDYPLFIFLPGMDGTGKLLRSQVTDLENVFDVRSLSIPPNDRMTWDVLTNQVVSLLKAELNQKINQTVYLCGESFGGCLAMKVILLAPTLIKRLILINPASAFHQNPWIAWGSQITQWVPDWLYQGAMLGVLPFLAALERINISNRYALWKAMQSVPQENSVWRLSLLKHFQISAEQLGQLTHPVLLIASGSDRLLPSVAESEYLLKCFSHATRVILPNSGHACLLETEINLVDILRKSGFLPFSH